MSELIVYEIETFHTNNLMDEDTVKYLDLKKEKGWEVDSTVPDNKGGYNIKLKRPKNSDESDP